MKRVLFLVFFSVLSICAKAQSVDSLQLESISIDSLSAKLNKLQRDYDFLHCQLELEQTLSSLKFLECEIRNSTQAIRIEMCAHNFDVDLYISFKEQYDSYVSYYNSLMDSVKLKKEKCGLMVDSVEFSAEQIIRLGLAIISIDDQCDIFDASFDYYKKCLEKYKKMR